MTAATKARDTQELPKRLRAFPMAAAAKAYAGTIACVDASGNATKGAVSTTLTVVGVFAQDYDNTAGAAGAITAEAKIGVFGPFANSTSTDLIEQKNIGGTAYIVDDSTVAKTDGTGTRSKAGKIHFVDASGVWLDFN